MLSTDTLIHSFVTACFILLMFKVYMPRKLDHSTPSELTTIGILGTFVGIFLGLWPFLSGSDISKNIPNLISGIAVAAICSICGMSLALLSKRDQRKARSKAIAKEYDGATADTLANLLQELLKQSIIQNDNLSSLQKSITGDEDSTLITQMQKTRTSFMDKQDQLILSFDSFAEKMAKNNSDALIEALQEVIKDFNAKINEQFGENFKHLNEAIGKLLEWQENYRLEITELQRQFQLCLTGIESSNTALSSLVEKSNSITEAAKNLEKLLNAYDSYQSNLSQHLEAFAHLSQEAQNAFPVIQGNLKQLTEEFSSAVYSSTSEIEQTVNKTSRILEEQVTKLDEALQAELTKSLNSLGSQLTSLSSKFVSDYTPLTAQLERLLQATNARNN